MEIYIELIWKILFEKVNKSSLQIAEPEMISR